MTKQAEREADWDIGRQLERRDAELMRYKSALVSLLTLAEADPSPLTNQQVAVICKHVLR